MKAHPHSPAERTSGVLRTGSVRTRTIVAVLVLLAMLLVALAVTVDATFGARLRAQIQERLEDRAAAAASLVGTVDSDELAERLSAQGLAVRIESAAGDETVAGPSPDQLRAGPPAGLGGPDGAGSRASAPPAEDSSAPVESSGETVVVTASTVTADDELITLASTLSDGSTLTLTASAASVAQTLVQLRWVMAAASLAVLVLATIGVVIVVRTTLRPLDRVTRVARSIAAGDRGRRLRPSQPRTEIGRVATAFDEMLDDVEGAERTAIDAELRMRTFVSDAAHELRTPVAGIRAAADTLVRSELSVADRELLAAQIAREAARASRLIDDLLTMARLDRGLELAPVMADLRELVQAESARVNLRRPSLRVHTVIPSAPVRARADIDRLGQVVANLVDNAARETAGVGLVRIEVSRAGEWAVIAVTDDGPGVPIAEQERIFDRLVRLDSARDSHAGAGLGLPIARGIARAHGGDVVCVPVESGARFELRVPIVDDQRTNRTSVSVSPRKGSVWVSPSRVKPLRS